MKTIKIKKPQRTYSGEQWKTNNSNKKRLVIDFDSKCAYCDDYDFFAGGYNSYHVEHFAPKDKFKHLEFTYENLLYACPYCNGSKSNKWVGKDHSENIVGNKGFVDPCTEEYYKHLERDTYGDILYITELGHYIYRELNLGLARHKIIYNLERLRSTRILLKTNIERKKSLGEDVHKLEKICSVISDKFCDYYDLLIDEDKRNRKI